MVEHIDFDDFINIDLTRAARRLQRIFLKNVLQAEALSLQEWRVLLNLYRFGSNHVGEIARLASLDPSPLSKAVGALEDRRLVTRQDDPSDARRKRLTLTKNGQEVVERVWPQALALSEHVRAEIGKTRYNALQDAAKKIQTMADPSPALQAAE